MVQCKFCHDVMVALGEKCLECGNKAKMTADQAIKAFLESGGAIKGFLSVDKTLSDAEVERFSSAFKRLRNAPKAD